MKISSIIISLTLLLLTSCSDFDELKLNENLPNSVPPSLLLNGALYDLHDEPFGSNERWCQYFLINYSYYGNNRYDFGAGKNYYTTLKNVEKIKDESSSLTEPEVKAYDAVAEFIKAYLFTKMSLEMGDIPMSEALEGVSNLTPKYDAQKDVFTQAFALLESANTELAELISAGESPLKGDFYYNNDLSKWQKLVNTYRLRLLIHLSKKVDDADLKVKQQFADIIGNPAKYPVMESANDNLQFTYIYPTNLYPNNPGNFGYDALRDNCSDTYVGLLKQLKDPRLFITSEPVRTLIDATHPATSFDVFVGANAGEDLGEMYNTATSGGYSLLNRYRYYRTYTGEPTLEVSYQEMCFNIAEAINRGWITSGTLGTAEDYYQAGIKTSMVYYDIPEAGNLTVHFFKAAASLSDADPYDDFTIAVDWNNYYNQPTVKYAGDNATGLTQILQQKYIALYRHSGLESYFTYRRTGVPSFGTGPGTGNNQKIAMRFQYPDNEKTTNTDNYNEALKQYNGKDDINGIMWILK
nr:SusD/RagB family nutrient-binding outer membrane lipoprotein [uncultured Bacteroides sp.]